jgi:hypothetical protein
MTTEYKETYVGEEDTETTVLSALADGHPYVFIVTKIDADGGLDLKVGVGNGVSKPDTIRAILEKTLRALP